jgi:hypothetical protein
MGHKVDAIPLPTNQQATDAQIADVRARYPGLAYLKERIDAIIISGPEHVGPWIDQVYGRDEWKMLNVPKAAWLHESCVRDDYQIDFNHLAWMADEWFFPAIQDAEFHDQDMFCKGRSHYLPLGVDTEVFKSSVAGVRFTDASFERNTLRNHFDVAFIGLMYPKRVAFIKALQQHKIPPIHNGRVVGQVDLFGYDYEGAARLLASNYRVIKVFFNMPALSRLLVSKVFEVMACGTFLMTPQIPPEAGAAKNMLPFESGRDLIYYRSSNLPFVAQLLNEWSSPDKDAERQRIAKAGCKLVHEKHSLNVRMQEMLIKSKVGVIALG